MYISNKFHGVAQAAGVRTALGERLVYQECWRRLTGLITSGGWSMRNHLMEGGRLRSPRGLGFGTGGGSCMILGWSPFEGEGESPCELYAFLFVYKGIKVCHN